MKTVGLLGGMSWVSSLHYYQRLNAEIAARTAGAHSARCVLYSIDFKELETLQHAHRWAEADALLAAAAAGLARAGADFILICANTMHRSADAVARASGLPLLHIADAVGTAARTQQIKALGVLGTGFLMQDTAYLDRIAAASGAAVLIPTPADRDAVHRIIFEELTRERVTAPSRAEMVGVAKRLVDRGADAILLACTELGMILHPGDVPVPVLDSLELHVAAACDYALVD